MIRPSSGLHSSQDDLLEEGSANYFAHEILLEHSHTHSYVHIAYDYFRTIAAELCSHDEVHRIDATKSEISTFWPLKGNVCASLS